MQNRGALKRSIEQYEKQTGTFSRYACEGGITGEQISFDRKPAQQFLALMGCSSGGDEPLTMPGEDYEITSVTISGFTKGSKSTLTIAQDRIEELKASAKVYTNPKIITAATYQQASGTLSSQDAGISPNGVAWQNLAAGVCHAQKIDLLVKQAISEDGKAITAEKSGHIAKGDKGIMLLSTPALNFAYGAAQGMPDQQAEDLIKNMYRLLFSAALDNGCTHITLPAAGLGVFGGKPEMYFKCMLEAAKEYPELNVIYNPAQFGKQFSEALANFEKEGGTNVAVTDRDVLFLADEMAKNGISCAMHNPSDADVVYGVYDVGQYWKKGKGSGYVGEEHIGAISTAPFNSRGLNPEIYDKPIELKPRSAAQVAQAAQAVKQQQPQPIQAPQATPPLKKAPLNKAGLLAALQAKSRKAEVPSAQQDNPVAKRAVEAVIEADKPAPAKNTKLKKRGSGISTEALAAARASLPQQSGADEVAKMTPAQLIEAANNALQKQFPGATIEPTRDGVVIKLNVRLNSPPPHTREQGAEQFKGALAEMNIKHADVTGSYRPIGGMMELLKATHDGTQPEVVRGGPVVAVTAQIGISDIQAFLSKQEQSARKATTPDSAQQAQAQAQPLIIRLETADVKKLQQQLQIFEPKRTIKDTEDLKDALQFVAAIKQTTLPAEISIQQVGGQFNIQLPKDQQSTLMKLLDKPQVELPERKKALEEKEKKDTHPTPSKSR